MRLLIDAVGIYYTSAEKCQKVAYEIVKNFMTNYAVNFIKIINVILIIDEKGGNKYVNRVVQCLYNYLRFYPEVEKIGGVECPYTCLCSGEHPKCGVVGEHEVYAAPCQCEEDDWLLLAKCC